MLCYLSNHLPADVSGKIEYFINYLYDSKIKSSLENKGTLKVSANIRNFEVSMAFDSFESISYDKDSSFISGIKFNRVPAWEIEDYRTEIMELWDDVRKSIENYFR